MKNKGFTLLEILVVVLVIGILATIAVPKYRKAVIKSKYSTLKNVVNSITEAQEAYILAHGKFAESFADLDLTMPPVKDEEKSTGQSYIYPWGYCHFGGAGTQVICGNSDIKMQYQAHPRTGSSSDGRKVCISFEMDLKAPQNIICQQETKDVPPASLAGRTYIGYRYQK